jgi:uncharacterized protein YlxW (UPF0749 family)
MLVANPTVTSLNGHKVQNRQRAELLRDLDSCRARLKDLENERLDLLAELAQVQGERDELLWEQEWELTDPQISDLQMKGATS